MKSKLCSKCKRELELNRVGKQRYCLKCHAEHMRNTRPNHSELTDLQRFKSNSRSYANQYQKRGILISMPCEECGDVHSEKHHDDYSKPINVK